MAHVAIKGTFFNTCGNLPSTGSAAPEFTLTKTDLSEISLRSFKGKKVVLNIFPSLDTSTCAMSVRRFNAELEKMKNTVVLCISADLPFAQKRFCGAEGLANVIPLSTFRHPEFGDVYGVRMADSDLKGLMSRAVVVINEEGKVVYTEQVAEITMEPDYGKAIQAVK
jgi:thioredoxin-dependent peroxiredoxin